MNEKRFEEVHACALARRKPIVPPATTSVPFSSHEQSVVVADHSLECSISSLKKFVRKKRKATSSSASSSSQGETVELVDANEWAPTRKVRKVS